MLIACPDCNAGYDVPDGLLVNARMMRCAACGHDWMTEALETPVDAATMGLAGGGAPEIDKINCPACDAVYELPAVMLTVQRMMRCSTCGHDWETRPRGMAPRRGTPVAANPPVPASAGLESVPAAVVAEPDTTPLAATATDTPAAPTAAPDAADDVAGAAEAGDAGHDSEAEAEVEAEAEAEAEAFADVQAVADMPAPSLMQRVLAVARASQISLAGWAVSLVVLVVMMRTVAGNRASIAEAWPPSQRLFLWLGLS